LTCYLHGPSATGSVVRRTGDRGTDAEDVLIGIEWIMTRARAGLAICFGLFGITAMTLLFRAAFESLAGRDVCLGLFLAGSFLWIGLGAVLAGNLGRSGGLEKIRELLLVGCIPTSYLQYGLIRLLWNLAGVGAEVSTASMPFYLLVLPVLVTAPLGLLMGLLWATLSRSAETPVGTLYGFEALGGAVGGLGTTLLLNRGVETPSIFLIVATLVCLSAVWSSLTKSIERPRWITRTVATLCLLAVLAGLGLRVDESLAQRLREDTWNRAVPDGQFEGQFQTLRATYLYGTDEDRWVVVRGNGVYETVSDSPEAGRVVAMALAQNFMAQRVLVIGDGLAVCRGFLKSANVTAVDWAATDPDYAQAVLDRLPESLQIADERFHCLTDDPETILSNTAEPYDVVVLNLPGPFNGSFHQLASVDFFGQVKEKLSSLGLVVFGVVNDGQPIASDRPAYQAAWIKGTLDTVFSRTIIVPQDDGTFVLGADTSYLEISPVTLETRFSLLQNAGEIFLPESLSSVYQPDRMLAALEAYDRTDLPERGLVNTDIRPYHYLAGLQPFIRPWRLSLTRPAHLFARGGLTLAILPIALLALLRTIYVVRTAPRAGRWVDPVHCSAVVSNIRLTSGLLAFASLSTFVLLIYAFQIHFGSLFSELGLLAALFAFGAALGTFGAQWMVSRQQRTDSSSLFSILCALAILLGLHAGCLIGAGFWIEQPWPQSTFVLWLGVAGVFFGGALALGASALRVGSGDIRERSIGIENVTALGAAAGVAVVTLLLLPLLGFGATLHVIAVVVLAGTIGAAATYYRSLHPGPGVIPHRVLTPLGYGLFGVAACVIIGSHVLAQREQSQAKSLDTLAIEDWAQGRKVSAKTVTLGETANEVTYHEVREDSQLKGYIFRSEDFTGTVYGYGGPMSIIAFADPNGKLIDFRITRSRETPRYIRRISDWMSSLKGATVFGPEPVAGVDVVSGATLSCDAILDLLGGAGPRFASTVLAQGQTAKATGQHWMHSINWPVVCWLMSLPLAIVAIFHGRLWSRIVVLAYTVGAGGFWLNRQFSTDQVTRLLKGDGLLDGSIGSLCLLLGVPLLIVLFGNLYCGYLCPFGALQELIGFVIPKRFKPKLSLAAIGVGRFVKYALLFVLVVAVFIIGSKRFLDVDPLTSFFNPQFWLEGPWTNAALIIALVVLAGGLLVTRLWCRYLCPTGAFLSLLNLGGWLRNLLPAKKFGRCEFGLGGRDHLDCIYCDRCRYNSALVPARGDVTTPKGTSNLASWLFLIIVVALAVSVVTPTFREPPKTVSPETTAIEPEDNTRSTAPMAEREPSQRRRRRGRER